MLFSTKSFVTLCFSFGSGGVNCRKWNGCAISWVYPTCGNPGMAADFFLQVFFVLRDLVGVLESNQIILPGHALPGPTEY